MNEARASKVWLQSLSRGDAAQSRVLAAPRGRGNWDFSVMTV